MLVMFATPVLLFVSVKLRVALVARPDTKMLLGVRVNAAGGGGGGGTVVQLRLTVPSGASVTETVEGVPLTSVQGTPFRSSIFARPDPFVPLAPGAPLAPSL